MQKALQAKFFIQHFEVWGGKFGQDSMQFYQSTLMWKESSIEATASWFNKCSWPASYFFTFSNSSTNSKKALFGKGRNQCGDEEDLKLNVAIHSRLDMRRSREVLRFHRALKKTEDGFNDNYLLIYLLRVPMSWQQIIYLSLAIIINY